MELVDQLLFELPSISGCSNVSITQATMSLFTSNNEGSINAN